MRPYELQRTERESGLTTDEVRAIQRVRRPQLQADIYEAITGRDTTPRYASHNGKPVLLD